MFVLLSSRNQAVSPNLPSNAGQQITSIVRDPNALSPRMGFSVLCGYTVALMAIAAWLTRRRDA
jgi:ABC-2 type transport system permease protein